VAPINSPPASVPRLKHTSWYISDHYICLQYLLFLSLIFRLCWLWRNRELVWYIHRMQIWRTTRSSPRTSRMKARLVSLWCFVWTMLSQKSLGSSSIRSVLFRPPYAFLCSWMPLEGSEIFHSRESVFFFSVSLFSSEGKTDEGNKFTIAEGTV